MTEDVRAAACCRVQSGAHEDMAAGGECIGAEGGCHAIRFQAMMEAHMREVMAQTARGRYA